MNRVLRFLKPAELLTLPLKISQKGYIKPKGLFTIILSLLYRTTPKEVKMLMIDPKKVELTSFSQLPHMIAPVITEVDIDGGHAAAGIIGGPLHGEIGLGVEALAAGR